MTSSNRLTSSVSRADIEELIPHGQSMCLLDGVQQWDRDGIVALCFSHHQTGNPLLDQGSLPAVTLVEYAAQAAAVHAGLTGTGPTGGQAAFIGAIKGLKLHRQRAPQDAATLFCEAKCTFNNGNGAIYQIAVRSEHALIIEGRLVLVMP
jgi:predicted hotdog family 3-hydroxylacyl-ACP dehydratase